MKNKVLLIVIITISACSIIYAQATKGPVSGYQYCELVYMDNWAPLSSDELSVNYSDKTEKLAGSTISALNSLGEKGWDLVVAYIDEGDSWTSYYYTFKRKK